MPENIEELIARVISQIEGQNWSDTPLTQDQLDIIRISVQATVGMQLAVQRSRREADYARMPCDNCSSYDFRCARGCVVHILHHGRPFCAFQEGTPDQWPANHKWVGQEQATDASCLGCLEEKRVRDQ